MMIEGCYFFEPLSDNFTRAFKIDNLYYQGKTKYQYIQCFYNQYLGKVLFIDGKIQSAQIDEFVYHESLVHPGLLFHPSPRDVLVLGGGEGATVREVLRHNTVKKVTMVDIDRELIEICKTYLPEWSEGAFSDPKINLIFSDARSFVEKTRKKFDVIISDLTEPVEKGPSVYLFTREFFERIFESLKEDGLFILQAGSADFCYNQFYSSLTKTLEGIFPVIRPYWTFVLSFSLPWGFILASKQKNLLALEEKEIAGRMRKRGVKNLKYYHPGMHRGYFALPLYLMKNLKKGKILTDKKPFIWKL